MVFNKYIVFYCCFSTDFPGDKLEFIPEKILFGNAVPRKGDTLKSVGGRNITNKVDLQAALEECMDQEDVIIAYVPKVRSLSLIMVRANDPSLCRIQYHHAQRVLSVNIVEE